MLKKFIENNKNLILIIIIAFIISRFFAFSIVFGKSMYPTFDHGDYVFVNRISYKIDEPKRGDIIVFKSHLPGERYLIKRIIGIPGDTVEIKDNKVFLNGKELNEAYIKEKMYFNDMKVTVEPDKYFVMGDNRNNSLDSRYAEVGQVEKSRILGKVEFKLFKLPIKK